MAMFQQSTTDYSTAPSQVQDLTELVKSDSYGNQGRAT